jgi:hypothetical protein
MYESLARTAVKCPTQHIRIENLPMASLSHVRSNPGSSFNQTFCYQHANGLSIGSARDSEIDAGLDLLRQQRAGGASSTQNGGADVVCDSLVDRRGLAGGARRTHRFRERNCVQLFSNRRFADVHGRRDCVSYRVRAGAAYLKYLPGIKYGATGHWSAIRRAGGKISTTVAGLELQKLSFSVKSALSMPARRPAGEELPGR